ncbi:hypothetical protein Tco_0688178 [Tanacetum coccineum]
MKQDKAKQAARDESLVSSNARVKISNARVKIGTNNLRMEEKTYQVALDIFKITLFYNAFLVSADVPEIYMQQFWFTIKKVQNSSSYQFVIDHKTCEIDADIFKKILDISLIATKEHAAPKKATTSSKKKLTKRKLVISDESDMSEGELEHRPLTRRIRTPSIFVIKEPPSVPIKKTQESSRKLKGIEMLSEVAHEELDTQKEIKASKRESRFQHKTGNSSEGAGLRSEVPDEQTRKSVVSSEGVDISSKGSTDEETKIKDDDEDDASEEEENEEESFSEEENVDKESEEESDDDDNRSFDITNTNDERTESDFDDHEISKEGKTVAETEEEETANSEHEEDVTKGDDQKSDEEPKVDNQAKETKVEVPYLVKIKEKSEFL